METPSRRRTVTSRFRAPFRERKTPGWRAAHRELTGTLCLTREVMKTAHGARPRTWLSSGFRWLSLGLRVLDAKGVRCGARELYRAPSKRFWQEIPTSRDSVLGDARGRWTGHCAAGPGCQSQKRRGSACGLLGRAGLRRGGRGMLGLRPGWLPFFFLLFPISFLFGFILCFFKAFFKNDFEDN